MDNKKKRLALFNLIFYSILTVAGLYVLIFNLIMQSYGLVVGGAVITIVGIVGILRRNKVNVKEEAKAEVKKEEPFK